MDGALDHDALPVTLATCILEALQPLVVGNQRSNVLDHAVREVKLGYYGVGETSTKPNGCGSTDPCLSTTLCLNGGSPYCNTSISHSYGMKGSNALWHMQVGSVADRPLDMAWL